MVACAALSSVQPPNHLAVAMNASAQTVDMLKERLQSAIDNDQEESCQTVLDELRTAVTNREVLESTRIGFYVNELRKNALKKWPNLSKRTRELIRAWQEIINDDRRPQSGSSSRNTTPNVLSPSVAKLARRGITPNTPAGRRVTSTGLQGRTSATVSPANGSYAPKSQISPAVANGLHKSQSVGGDLLNHVPITPKENGKRKAIEELVTSTAIKRTKTVAGSLDSPTVESSVSAARKAAQSTTELFAQMNTVLPTNITIDTTLREEKLKQEKRDEEFAMQLQAASNLGTERRKRKYEKKQKVSPNSPATFQNLPPIAEEIAESKSLVFRFNKNGFESASSQSTPKLESKPAKISKKHDKSQRSIAKETTPPRPMPEETVVDGPEETKPKPNISSRKSWNSLIPSMAELRLRAEKDDAETEKFATESKLETAKDPTKVQRVKNYRRPILMLPYLNNSSLRPDFLVHKYPNKNQYYSEDNYLFGTPRPPVSS